MKRITLNIDLDDNEVFDNEIADVIRAKVREITRDHISYSEAIQNEIKRKLNHTNASTVVQDALYAVVKDVIAQMDLRPKINEAVDAIIDQKIHNCTMKVDAKCDEVLQRLLTDKLQAKIKTILSD